MNFIFISPHPDPLPMGEGEKQNTLFKTDILFRLYDRALQAWQRDPGYLLRKFRDDTEFVKCLNMLNRLKILTISKKVVELTVNCKFDKWLE